MVDKIWKIPIDKVIYGIQKALYNSAYFQDLAIGHLNRMEDELKKGGTRLLNVHAVVFLYYGIEELGKAIILYEKLIQSKENSDSEITVNQYVGNHNVKLNKAKEMYPELIIHNFQPENDWVMTELRPGVKMSQTEKFVPTGDLLSDFKERSNSWLATWYPERSTWEEPENFIDEDQVRKVAENLDKLIRKWHDDISCYKTS